jgi:hypothetical protein
MQVAFYLRSRNLPKTVGVSGPSSAAKAGVAASPASLPTPSGDLSLIIFTSTYENFLQTAGLQDGASHCAKILSSMYAALNSDPSDPDVIIKLDISNAFNVLCRHLTLDVLGGKASCDYACVLKEGDNIETVCEELRNMFQYFRAMRTTKSQLRYFDYLGNVLDAWGKTGGQQGDPLEMIVFCLTVHHLWGRTLNKHHQDACAVAYADDSYIKAKLSVALEVLSDIKHVLKEDDGLALNFDKTKILVKGLSAADAHAAAQRMLAADPSLAHLSALLSPCLDQRRHGSARTCSLHCTLTPAARLHAHACSLHCTLGAIRSGTRYAKWAGGSRSQTHRRAAMGGFTQDDGYVRGVAPTHSCCSESFSNC